MEETKAIAIAIAGYRRVLEDGIEICPSESASEHSEQGEQYSDSEMCTTDVLGDDGDPVLAKTTLTTEQANCLCNQGRAGGNGPVSRAEWNGEDAGSVRIVPDTCQRDYSQATPRIIRHRRFKGLEATAWIIWLRAAYSAAKQMYFISLRDRGRAGGHEAAPREQSPGSPFPSDNEDKAMTYDQERPIRRFMKVRRPDTNSGTGRQEA
jgi:hypothetical protein